MAVTYWESVNRDCFYVTSQLSHKKISATFIGYSYWSATGVAGRGRIFYDNYIQLPYKNFKLNYLSYTGKSNLTANITDAAGHGIGSTPISIDSMPNFWVAPYYSCYVGLPKKNDFIGSVNNIHAAALYPTQAFMTSNFDLFTKVKFYNIYDNKQYLEKDNLMFETGNQSNIILIRILVDPWQNNEPAYAGANGGVYIYMNVLQAYYRTFLAGMIFQPLGIFSQFTLNIEVEGI